ncbi:tRNA dimethylallyltransferase 2-like [Chenopodium quinoa]|uniref:C2H2-type domain-containing protein n=1 Tax=Chenopodium quinoa TaxID=63459 RepID=A0A803LD66_CHEQI|nr:tRNA dimethylallyltransferase 2-like [Chenopodium quinoa]
MELQNPNNGEGETKPKIVVIMGPTGSGKSKLAIDLATHFPIEIINADSMQVYHSLDVLTNKVTLSEQKEVPHHLLGTISPNVEFTAKDFRDAAIPIIKDILSRNHLPVIVGGTNFYIQALVSSFLLDDSVEEISDSCLRENSDVANLQKCELFEQGSCDYSYDRLRDLDPVAANRIHPNDHRKIRQYLELFTHSEILPSQLFQGEMTEKWGRLGCNSRYNCCFVCVDASLPVLDRFVDQRVDRMIEAGLLNEVYDIYNMNTDYTRGLRQAIGVREFEDFLCANISEVRKERNNSFLDTASLNNTDVSLRQNLLEVSSSSSNTPDRRLLEEAISKLKQNTRRLVRRQKRRINRLQTLFGWNIHFVDSTESLLGNSEDTWISQVIEPAAKVISSFLNSDVTSASDNTDHLVQKLNERDLWTQYTCKACDKILRGAHEWKQHNQGRGHRKRMAKLKKRQGSFLTDSLQLPGGDCVSSDASQV